MALHTAQVCRAQALLRHEPYYMRLLYLLFCWVYFISAAGAQDVLAAREAYDIGASFLEAGDYKKAKRFFERAIKFDPNFTEARRLLGYAAYFRQDYPSAIEAFTQVLQVDTNFSRLLYYELGDLYYKMDRPDLALHSYRKFEALQSRPLIDFGIRGERELPNEREALVELPNKIRAVRITLDSATFINATRIVRLGRPVNSRQNDYFPFFSNDGRELWFTRQNDKGDEDLIYAKRLTTQDDWTTSQVGSFNTNKPEGMVSLVRDGERVYFTQCRDQDTEVKGCNLYTGLMVNGKVTEVTPLPDYINSDSWESQAGISCDGRQLFFASTRPGGLGGSDIWTTSLGEDGRWQKPTNLGAPVNTAGNEEAPFLSNDGQTLYFSSDGHPGLGDQDIYAAWWDAPSRRWFNPVNLGPPVNSPHRELGFHLTADNQTGYFASDRPGGEGGLDIYTFTLSDKLTGEPITYVSGYLLDSLSGIAIGQQAVKINGGATYMTNAGGRFFLCVGSDEVLEFSTQPSEYLPYRNSFAIPRWQNQYPYRIDLLLQQQSEAPDTIQTKPTPPPPPSLDSVKTRKVLVVQNYSVLFSFDDATLIPRQRESLDLFVANLQDGDIQSVEILGFADDIGGDDYNLQLSEARARAVGSYLRSKGIGTTQVSIKGMGILTGGQRELNRKVEIRVRILKAF